MKTLYIWRITSFVLVFLFIFHSGVALGQSTATISINNFQAIVTINSYTEDEDGFLVNYAQGSGVIISSNGLVLTNRHVVFYEEELDSSERPSTYQICIPAAIMSEPDCFYTGSFIAADKDLDVALLQLHPINELGNSQPYQSITWNLNNQPETNDPITTIGYPDIGGKTLHKFRNILHSIKG